MGITFIGLLLILIMIFLGYFHGILRILVAIGALVIASILASPFSFLTQWIAKGISAIPLALKPSAGIFMSGIFLFLILQLTGEHFIAKREKELKKKELPPMREIERYGGALFGAVWGLFLILLVLTGIDIIESVQETMNRVTLSAAQRNLVRRQEIKETKKISAVSAPGPIAPETESIAPVPESVSPLKSELESSIYYPMVKKITPMDERATKTLEKLMKVVGDEELFDKFQNHPVVAKLAKNPKIVDLSKDPAIKKAIQANNFKELLDNPLIASIANDREIHDEFKNIDINSILDEVMKKEEE